MDTISDTTGGVVRERGNRLVRRITSAVTAVALFAVAAIGVLFGIQQDGSGSSTTQTTGQDSGSPGGSSGSPSDTQAPSSSDQQGGVVSGGS